MPATYAHLRFGREIRPGLTDAFRSAVGEFPALYSWGLHGPDVLFYHKPFQKTPLNAMASPLHDRSGKWFFTRAAEVIAQSPQPQAALAYTVGCLCHFVLDALCHGYVEDMARRGTASHAAIESDLDRALLEADGISPFRFSLTAHLRPSPHCAGIIAPFYPDVQPRQMLDALRGMKRYGGLLHPRNKAQRMLTRKVLTATAPAFCDLMLPESPDPRCAETTRQLLSRFSVVYPACVEALDNYACFLSTGRPLAPLFSTTFNGAAEKDAALI